MGLDTVELIFAIEDEFGLDIPDEVAERMTTVGEVYEWLIPQLVSAEPIACLTQRMFYQVRRALVANFNLDRRKIHPRTRLSELISFDELEAGWIFLGLYLEPKLKLPNFRKADGLFGLLKRRETFTVRDLTESFIALNGRALSPQRESKEEIWNRLVKIFLRQLNVSPDEVRPEASITKNLGAD